jgi:hypothetical protein
MRSTALLSERGHHKVRQKERRDIGGRRKRAAHRRGRIPLGKPADWRSSDDEFLCPRGVSDGGAKREKERSSWALYSGGVAWRGG